MNELNRQKHERQNLNILFVIVLYKSRLEQSATYLSLLKSLSSLELNIDLLVYDNSPDGTVDHFNSEPKVSVTCIADSANSGVSKAYNIGAEIAAKMNKKWVLLLDQDTSFPSHTIQEYLLATNKYPDEKLFAPIMVANQKTIISPCYFKFMRGFSVSHVDAGINSLNKFSVINCGMCVDVDAFNKNGGYDERIKLDFSDHDFIRRFRKTIGDRFIVIDLTVCHSLSSATKNNFNSDMVRLDYYLEGAKYISSSLIETFFLKLNATLRSIKLSLIHRNIGFLIKLLKWI